MAETKTLQREYTIPLRRAWLNVPAYERTRKAVKEIKKFIARHMKVTDRDVNNVKLDIYFNNELWFRGRAHPPARVRVRARKEGELVHVSFVETPANVTFSKAKHDRRHAKAEPKAAVKKEESAETKVPAKTEEQKADEKEKEMAVAEQNTKVAEQEAKAQKHVTKAEKHSHPQRMALKK